MVKTFKNLLQNQKCDDLETWHEASMTSTVEPYKVCINYDLELTLTYFMARSNLVAHAFAWGYLLEGHLMGKTCSK